MVVRCQGDGLRPCDAGPNIEIDGDHPAAEKLYKMRSYRTREKILSHVLGFMTLSTSVFLPISLPSDSAEVYERK